MKASVIIPAFNAAKTIRYCLETLTQQTIARSEYEIILVDDGSQDDTVRIAGEFGDVKIIKQTNSGPAAARNHGVSQALAPIVVFTDSDCTPRKDWLERMIAPLEADQKITAVKGAYRTKQREFAARFVQLEYQDKYRILARRKYIDFIDTYSAAFRKDVFLDFGGYDTSFKVACAEDVELSYRLGNAGHRMIFAPEAIVYHLHPDRWLSYFKKKYKFAYWRVLAVKKNPNKMVSDSHTPQVMKLQMLLAPAVVAMSVLSFWGKAFCAGFMAALTTFILLSLPFLVRAIRQDVAVALISPGALFGRAIAQFGGVFRGFFDWYLVKK